MSTVRWLQKRASRVARTMFAALPLPTRLFYVLASMSGVELQAIGRSLGVIFIRKKIHGLPDVNGKPALEIPVDQHRDPTKLLPPSYLGNFAADLRRTALAKFKNEQLVDTGISSWLLRFVVEGAWKDIREGSALGEVYKYVHRSLDLSILNEIQHMKRKRHDYGWDSIDQTDEEGSPIMQPHDPKSEAQFFHNLPTSALPKVRKELEQKVHPDAPLYLDLLLEGYSPAEILGRTNRELGSEVLLPHLRNQGLKAPYKWWSVSCDPKIQKILLKYMQSPQASV